MKNTEKSGSKLVLNIYLKHMYQNWRYTLPTFLLVGIGNILIFYIPPLIIADIIKKANDSQIFNLGNAWHYALAFGLIWLFGEAMWRLAYYLLQRFESNSMIKFYDLAMDLIIKKDISFFNDSFSGSITKNIISFGRRFESFFDTILFNIVGALFPMVFVLIALTIISPILSLITLGMLGLGIIIIRSPIIYRVKLVKDREEKHTKLAGHISDVMTNIGIVKSHGLEESENLISHKHVKDFALKTLKSWEYQNNHIDMVLAPLYVLTNVFGLLVILSFGIDNNTKAALFISFNYFANISRFFWEFSGIYRRIEESITEASLFAEYMLIPNKIKDNSNNNLIVSSGQIEFKNVSFNHAEATHDALFNDLNLIIKPGEKVGLVGHSGAGKTTLVGLLERFIDVDLGEILIDGQNIALVTQASLHQNISYVPQEPSLFHRSLRDNISYGKQDASEAEIIKAAKKANAWEFIEVLPNGLDTLVGERGVKLSGGQRQRVAIARAILKNAPILVLDEATSALDSESEKLIQDSFSELMKDRTSIVIAHRLSTIAKLDRIIVLENGEIVEEGTHQELLKINGIYAKLWSHQSGGFIE